jgi:glycine cleavage system H lipoate-binding protein
MVFVLVLLTIGIFIAVDYVLRREDRVIKEIGKEEKSPIFLSPEKSLRALENGKKRLYHLSHSWAQPTSENYVYVGFDNFITSLFSEYVRMEDLPLVGTHIPQGTKIWNVGLEKHKVPQLSPLSGKVVDINPACKMNLPLPTEDVENSWIIKLNADNLENESNNLMKHSQAEIMNAALNDDLILSAQNGHYLNDGGKIDPLYIEKMPENDWKDLLNRFFPYHETLK